MDYFGIQKHDFYIIDCADRSWLASVIEIAEADSQNEYFAVSVRAHLPIAKVLQFEVVCMISLISDATMPLGFWVS
jgi:hypothetical protein